VDSLGQPIVVEYLLTSDASDCGAVDHWLSRPFAPWAHRTVRCTPNSLVIFSQEVLRILESDHVGDSFSNAMNQEQGNIKC
jgi:hypothetical protein